jgi:hypothetical protein
MCDQLKADWSIRKRPGTQSNGMKGSAFSVARLTDAGLLVSEWSKSDELAPSGRIDIAKPRSVVGHAIPDYEVFFGAEGVLLDAPCLWVEHALDGSWRVVCHDFIPSPVPEL